MNVTGGNLQTQFKLLKSKCVTYSNLLKVTASSDKHGPLHWGGLSKEQKPHISPANSIVRSEVFQHGRYFKATKQQSKLAI
jgi:hypothetical protein